MQFYSSMEIKVIEIDSATTGLDEMYKQSKEAIFHQYKHLDFIYVNEDNEKELLVKLTKDHERKAAVEAKKKEQ